jgi:hypothetical protein
MRCGVHALCGPALVHALRPARSQVVVKLGACRAPSLTQLRGRDTHALWGPCVVWSMDPITHGLHNAWVLRPQSWVKTGATGT